MKVITAPGHLADTTPLSHKEKVISYYEHAGPDYGTWSPGFNMHFGYYAAGMNPFDREAMLQKLNEVVIGRLELPEEIPSIVVDMGCGLGATMRHAATRFQKAAFKGITLVPWQVEQARKLNSDQKRIEVVEGDYCRTGIGSGSVDAVYALESACYATGPGKADLLGEMHRILRPGGRVAISDGFLKKVLPESGLLASTYRTLCNSWAFDELGRIDKVKAVLECLGFCDIRVEEVSWRIAPSVAHVPFVVVCFLLRQLFFGSAAMNRERWNNLKSPLLTMILGLARRSFGYYIVTARKSI